MKKRNAFTLIELSIVLVIIGLIVGGVLVGQDLIRAAQARSFMAQATQYETAYNTFRLKYNCMPGDCINASTFGLGPNGNGNKIITPSTGIASTPCILIYGGLQQSQGECQDFWVHMSNAGLIANNGLQDYTSGNISGDQLGAYFPKWGDAYVMVIQVNGDVYIRSGLTEITGAQRQPRFSSGALSGDMMLSIANKYEVSQDCTGGWLMTSCPQVWGNKIIPLGVREPDLGWVYAGTGGSGAPEDSCVRSGQWQPGGKCNIMYKIN